MLDVMFYEVFLEEESFFRRLLPKHIKADFTSKTIQEDPNHELLSSVISIRTQSCIPKVWAQRLKGILARSTGYDHLLEYRKSTNLHIPCGYLADYCSRAVAEQAALIIMALMRKLEKQLSCFNAFKRDDLTGYECQGKNVLVIGVGHIGAEIVDICRGLRMNVCGVDIAPKINDLKYVPLEKGIPWADIVVCSLPLTTTTCGLLNFDLLKHAKSGMIFINISRGEISPISDLRKLLSKGILGGLGMDVYQEESHLAEYLRGHCKVVKESTQEILRLKEMDNVLFAPHNAFNTYEALERKVKKSIESIEMFLSEQRFLYPIPE